MSSLPASLGSAFSLFSSSVQPLLLHLLILLTILLPPFSLPFFSRLFLLLLLCSARLLTLSFILSSLCFYLFCFIRFQIFLLVLSSVPLFLFLFYFPPFALRICYFHSFIWFVFESRLSLLLQSSSFVPFFSFPLRFIVIILVHFPSSPSHPRVFTCVVIFPPPPLRNPCELLSSRFDTFPLI